MGAVGSQNSSDLASQFIVAALMGSLRTERIVVRPVRREAGTEPQGHGVTTQGMWVKTESRNCVTGARWILLNSHPRCMEHPRISEHDPLSAEWY